MAKNAKIFNRLLRIAINRHSHHHSSCEMERSIVLASLVSIAMSQGLLTITGHPRDTHVAPGGTVNYLNLIPSKTSLKAANH